jgi:hypothetical protein
VQELAESNQVCTSISNTINASTNVQQSLVNDIKSIVKTWRNRNPTPADALTHWYDVFGWRLQHYLSMLTLFDMYDQQAQVRVWGVLTHHGRAYRVVQCKRRCRCIRAHSALQRWRVLRGSRAR